MGQDLLYIHTLSALTYGEVEGEAERKWFGQAQGLRVPVFMDEYFEIVPPQPLSSASPAPDEVARGDYWSLLQREGHYVLEYISGELQGRLKQLAISLEEGEHIVRGETTVDQVLLAYGAG